MFLKSQLSNEKILLFSLFPGFIGILSTYSFINSLHSKNTYRVSSMWELLFYE